MERVSLPQEQSPETSAPPSLLVPPHRFRSEEKEAAFSPVFYCTWFACFMAAKGDVGNGPVRLFSRISQDVFSRLHGEILSEING